MEQAELRQGTHPFLPPPLVVRTIHRTAPSSAYGEHRAKSFMVFRERNPGGQEHKLFVTQFDLCSTLKISLWRGDG